MDFPLLRVRLTAIVKHIASLIGRILCLNDPINQATQHIIPNDVYAVYNFVETQLLRRQNLPFLVDELSGSL